MVSSLKYLIDNVVPQLPKSHTFLWDRTRSIRQDFTYQNYIGPEAVLCNELIARVHIVSLHIMLTSDVEYSKQQELEQFNKTLQTLSELYAANRKLDPSFRSPNEPEFRAYQLLSHINDTETLMHIQALPFDILRDARLQLALTLRSLVQHVSRNNPDNAFNLFASFFNTLVKNTSIPYLYLCLLETHFSDIRSNALASMAHAYHSRGSPYIVPRLTSMLGFDNDLDTISFCTDYGLKVVDDAQAGQCIIVTIDPKNLTPSTSAAKTYKSIFIDARKGPKTWSACIYNETSGLVPTKPFVSVKATQAMQQMKPLSTGFSNNTINSNAATSSSLKFSLTPSVQLGGPNQFDGMNQSTFVSPTQPNVFNAPRSSNASQIKSTIGGSSTFEKPLSVQPTSFSFGPTKTVPALSFSAPTPSPAPASVTAVPIFNPSATSFLTNKSSPLSATQDEKPKTPLFSLNEPRGQSKPFFTDSPKLNISFNKNIVNPTKEAVAQKVPAVVPPQPIIIAKSKPKYYYDDEDIHSEAKKLLKAFVVRTLRENIIPGAWKQVQRERADNIKRRNEACKSEMKDMIHELLVEEAMVAKAKQFDSLRLKRLAVRCISDAAYRAVVRAEEKERRKEEYLHIKNQLGRPRMISSPTPISRSSRGSAEKLSDFNISRSDTNNDSTKLRLSGRLNDSTIQTQEQITAKINQAQQVANRLWKPLDLATLSLPRLERSLKSQVHLYGKTKVILSCFCRDWDSVAGKWIKTKFQLEGPEISSNSGTTVLETQQLRDDDLSYRNLIQLAFVCGLDDDGRPVERNAEESISQYDAAALAAILQRVIPNSLFKVQLLIVSWTNLSEQDVLSLLKINDLKKELASITFCSIPNTSPISQGKISDPSQELEDAIDSMTAQFSALPSIRGQEARDREQIQRQAERRERQNRELLKDQNLLNSVQEQRFQQIQGMKWLNQFSVPVISPGNKRKRVMVTNEAVNGFTQFPIPASQVSLQHAELENVATPLRQNQAFQLPDTPVTPIQISSESSSSQNFFSTPPSSSSLLHGDSGNSIPVPKSVLELQELTASVLKRPKVNQV